jgi:superfamily II DNA or RNA helicase
MNARPDIGGRLRGLGKTLVAREIARQLPKGRGTRNVLYLCPNLQIAAQNRGKFISLTGIDEGEYHGG